VAEIEEWLSPKPSILCHSDQPAPLQDEHPTGIVRCSGDERGLLQATDHRAEGEIGALEPTWPYARVHAGDQARADDHGTARDQQQPEAEQGIHDRRRPDYVQAEHAVTCIENEGQVRKASRQAALGRKNL